MSICFIVHCHCCSKCGWHATWIGLGAGAHAHTMTVKNQEGSKFYVIVRLLNTLDERGLQNSLFQVALTAEFIATQKPLTRDMAKF
jgi:hypothetical protein